MADFISTGRFPLDLDISRLKQYIFFHITIGWKISSIIIHVLDLLVITQLANQMGKDW